MEKQKKPIYKNWWFWVLIVIVVGIIGSTLSEEEAPETETFSNQNKNAQVNESPSGVDNNEPQSQSDSKTETKEKVITEIGGFVETKNFRITVEDLKKPKGNEFNKPSDGKEFVQVVLHIENISNKDYTVSSILMFDAYYDGYSVTESISSQIADNSLSSMNGPLAAGKKLRGVLAYELPVEWETLEIDIDLTALSFSNDGEVKIILNNK